MFVVELTEAVSTELVIRYLSFKCILCFGSGIF